MKRKTKQPKPPPEVVVFRDTERQGWSVMVGTRRLRPVFATQMAAEDYCIAKLRQCPKTVGCLTTRHQELPHSSVWTGAPWDHNFANVIK